MVTLQPPVNYHPHHFHRERGSIGGNIQATSPLGSYQSNLSNHSLLINDPRHLGGKHIVYSQLYSEMPTTPESQL
jgi:hypothetical protein